ncbi:MAG TPA: hypothetical protein VNH18_09250, partial [Bryobacteraceae bacterium]|nr:hypothetical protein [Bryobacteraceae bacterium]
MHSASAVAAISERDTATVITPLVIVEATKAMHLRLLRKERDALQTAATVAGFETDLANGVFTVLPFPASAWDIARQFCSTHTP